MPYTQLAKKIFTEILETVPISPEQLVEKRNEGIVTSVNQIVTLIGEIIRKSKKNYSIADVNMLIPVEQFPGDLLWRLNNGSQEIDEDSKKAITIVTYSANEVPAQISAYRPGTSDGIRNIKPRLIDVYPDPKYDGFSIARFGKVIEADISFWVWGYRDDKGIRDRALLLRKIIADNVWYLKYKGIKEIIWTGSLEVDVWDKQNVVKYKKEAYKVTFTEIQEFKEKNIEQIVMQAGLI